MRLSISKQSCARSMRAAVLALAALYYLPAHAVDAADAIAGKFAADEKSSAASSTTEKNDKWLHEEARQAVERALAEEGERVQDAPQSAEKEGTAEATAEARQPAESDETAAKPGSADDAVQAAPVDAKTMEAESKDLADKLREVRRKREAGHVEADGENGAAKSHEPGLVEKAISGVASQVSGYISPLVEKRVSILIEMDVGKKGVRQWSKTADPMLCIHENCYLSRGPDKAAEKLTRSAAFGPGVALGKRGLACRSSPKCIFRDIDLETVEAKLQPVDLRFLRHDRREAKAIRADATCAIVEGKLSCLSPAAGEGWRAWIVPETVAQKAGVAQLEAALAKGLE